jgi:hypothetical protein
LLLVTLLKRIAARARLIIIPPAPPPRRRGIPGGRLGGASAEQIVEEPARPGLHYFTAPLEIGKESRSRHGRAMEAEIVMASLGLAHTDAGMQGKPKSARKGNPYGKQKDT